MNRFAICYIYTPGRGKLVPCDIIKETLQLAKMAYKDPDYTVAIAIVH